MNRRTVLTTLAAATALAAQSKETDEIKQAEAAFAQAATKADLAAMDKLLADDLVYTHSSGTVETKAQYLARLKSGAQKYSKIENTDTKIRVYGGDTAVLNTRSNMAGTNDSGPFNNNVLMLHVWVKQGGKWRLVTHQTTRLP